VDWLSCAYESCHACSHFLVVMFDQITMIWRATSIRSFVMDHCWWCRTFLRIAYFLKLCAAAALIVIN
jgi:hypothetical protein